MFHLSPILSLHIHYFISPPVRSLLIFVSKVGDHGSDNAFARGRARECCTKFTKLIYGVMNDALNFEYPLGGEYFLFTNESAV